MQQNAALYTPRACCMLWGRPRQPRGTPQWPPLCPGTHSQWWGWSWTHSLGLRWHHGTTTASHAPGGLQAQQGPVRGISIIQRQLQCVNSLAPGRSGFNFGSAIFNLVLLIRIFTSYDNALRWMSWDLPRKVNIASGNGLVPSGNKPLPEPVLTKISNAIWCH